MKEKKQSALSRLMGIAGGHKYFTYASCVLAILSAWIALIPFMIFIIAHRMRTVDGVDKIVVLKDGVVAEQGTPADLKVRNGIYKHMVDLQLQSEQWKYN